MLTKEKKYHYIYKTTNLLNGKYYIGMHSTYNLKDGYMGSGNILRHSIKKYGKENFKSEILEFCECRIEMQKREKEIVDLNEINKIDCMNLKVGGEGGWFIEIHHKAFKYKLENDKNFKTSHSLKISNRLKEEYKKGIRDNIKFSYDWNGKNHSEETKQKISETSKGNGLGETNSQYGTCWVTKDGLNKKIRKEELEANINDGWVKGRFTELKGELVINSKLKETDVIKIKELLAKGDLSQIKIGKMFNVQQETISKIKRKLIWK